MNQKRMFAKHDNYDVIDSLATALESLQASNLALAICVLKLEDVGLTGLAKDVYSTMHEVNMSHDLIKDKLMDKLRDDKK